MSEEKNMKDAMTLLESLRNCAKAHPVSAQQGLSLDTPAPNQLHTLKNNDEMPELFALVTQVNGTTCQIIPGSFEALQGGPADAVIPKSVMGGFAILSMDKNGELPVTSLGKGFARLDDNTYQKVLNTQKEFEGEGNGGNVLSYALPYIGISDERIGYHFRMEDVLSKAGCTRKNSRRFVATFSSSTQEALAAGGELQDICWSFSSKEQDISVTIEYSQTEKKFYLNVFSAEGNLSHKLDGCQLRMQESEAVLGTIQEGKLIVEWQAELTNCRFFLTDPNGKEISGNWTQQ